MISEEAGATEDDHKKGASSGSTRIIHVPGKIGETIACTSNPYGAVTVPEGLIDRFTDLEKNLKKGVAHSIRARSVAYTLSRRTIAGLHFKEDSFVAFVRTGALEKIGKVNFRSWRHRRYTVRTSRQWS